MCDVRTGQDRTGEESRGAGDWDIICSCDGDSELEVRPLHESSMLHSFV